MSYWRKIFGAIGASRPASAIANPDEQATRGRSSTTEQANSLDPVPVLPISAFVSHSAQDRHHVSFVGDVLQGAGIAPWIDRELIRAGEKFPERIRDGIARSDCLILLWSQAASRSDWVEREINTAIDAGKRIIPCRLDSTVLSESISDLHVIDLRTDVLGGLTDLLYALGRQGPDSSVFRKYYRGVFSRLLAFKGGQVDVSETKIPGLMFRIWGHETLPWKGHSLLSGAGLIASSRRFTQTNYGGDLESLFRSFLKEEGWAYTPVGTDHHGQMAYRTTTRCEKDGTVFSYAFVAEQLGSTEHGDSDWSGRIYLLETGHRQFFPLAVEWTRRRLPKDLLLSDDFTVRVEDELRVERHQGIELTITASFYCDLRKGGGFNPWFDQLLDMFVSYLRSTGHTVSSIGPAPPTVVIHNQANFRQATEEIYLSL